MIDKAGLTIYTKFREFWVMMEWKAMHHGNSTLLAKSIKLHTVLGLLAGVYCVFVIT